MSITVQEIQYKNYGKALEIKNEKVTLVVSLDLGPRVLSYSFHDGTNVFYNDLERSTNFSGDAMDQHYYKDAIWYIYGGHRLWLSPEVPATYYPDNNPIAYQVEGNTVTFTPNPQLENEVALWFSLTLEENSSKVKATHYVRNLSKHSKEYALWAISALAKDGLEIVPRPIKDTNFLANCQLSVWPYTDLADDRIYFGKRYITLRQDKNASCKFKIGMNNERGFAAYLLDDVTFICRHHHDNAAYYPDNNVSFETFTNNSFLELETLSPLYDAAPKQVLSHEENWELIRPDFKPAYNDENQIERFVNQYILAAE